MYKKIRCMWEKNKRFRLLVLLEGLLSLILLLSMFGKLKTEQIYQGNGEQQGEIKVEHLNLPTGVYEISAEYQIKNSSNSDLIEVLNEGAKGKLKVNQIPLRDGTEGVRFTFWLLGASDTISVRVVADPASGLEVSGIWLSQTHGGNRILLFWVLVISLAADGLWVYCDAISGKPEERKNRILLIGLIGIILVDSVPLLVDYCISGVDLLFHLIRIEGLKDGLLGGQFPVRIEPNWLFGHGYASAIFYSDLFLVIPSALRMVGFSMQGAYQLSLLFYNIVTALIAYWCFRGIFKDEYVGLIGSMLYSWTPYRIFNLYGRAGYGEMLALCFMPILFYGLYRAFTEDVNTPAYKKLWLLLTLGFTAVFQSHTLSFEIVSGMTALVCIVFLKRTFRKQTFLVLCKTVAATLLLNLWFLLPFLDYMVSDDFVFENLGAQQTIQGRGLYSAHFLFAFFKNGSNSHYFSRGMAQTDSIGWGFAVTLCLLVYVWLILVKRYPKQQMMAEGAWEAGLYQYGKGMAVIGLLTVWMSSNLFPWDRLQKCNALFDTLISSLEYPFRVFCISILCFIFVSCEVVWLVKRKEKKIYGSILICAVVGCAFITTQYLLDDTLREKEPLRLYNPENAGATYLDGSEYLKIGGSDYTKYFSIKDYAWSDGVQVIIMDDQETLYGHRNLQSSFYVSNLQDGEAYVEVPLINYKGYRAMAADTGQLMEIRTGENGRVRVILPEGFQGKVEVKFVVPWYWRGAEGVSLVMLLFMTVTAVRSYKKKKREVTG